MIKSRQGLYATHAALLGIILGGCAATKQPPVMKMTTKIPEGIATPDHLKTRIGSLYSFDGVPDKKTTQRVYDELAFQRATQAMLSTFRLRRSPLWRPVCAALDRRTRLRCSSRTFWTPSPCG